MSGKDLNMMVAFSKFYQSSFKACGTWLKTYQDLTLNTYVVSTVVSVAQSVELFAPKFRCSNGCSIEKPAAFVLFGAKQGGASKRELSKF